MSSKVLFFFFSREARVKAVLTGKRQTRKPQNQLGHAGRASRPPWQIFLSRAQGHGPREIPALVVCVTNFFIHQLIKIKIMCNSLLNDSAQ